LTNECVGTGRTRSHGEIRRNLVAYELPRSRDGIGLAHRLAERIDKVIQLARSPCGVDNTKQPVEVVIQQGCDAGTVLREVGKREAVRGQRRQCDSGLILIPVGWLLAPEP
jgi:hypothetical protein